MSTEHLTRVTFPSVSASQSAPASSGTDSGFVQGHAAGYAAGLRAAAAAQVRLQEQLRREHEEMLDGGRSALAHAVQVLQEAAHAARQRQEVALQDVQDVLAASALELAEAILGYELAQGTDTARGALSRVLSAQNGGSTGVERVTTIRLHSRDIATLEAAGVSCPEGVELRPDPALVPGDAIGEYPHGWIDARISTAVERAAKALLGGGE